MVSSGPSRVPPFLSQLARSQLLPARDGTVRFPSARVFQLLVADRAGGRRLGALRVEPPVTIDTHRTLMPKKKRSGLAAQQLWPTLVKKRALRSDLPLGPVCAAEFS